MAAENNTIGGGTGGGPDRIDHAETFDGAYRIAAKQVEMVSCPPLPPAPPGPNLITLLATDLTGMDGTVDVKGAKGVRLSAGPPIVVPTSSDSTNGVEIFVGESQNVTIQRGIIPGVDQKIEMAPGSITIDGGTGTITIQSLTEITLSVAGGMSSITLTPAGITIQGILVQ